VGLDTDEMKNKIRWMIRQILQALTVTKTTGIHLRAVFPFRWSRLYDYISIDNNAAVSEMPSDRDIVAAVSHHAVIDGNDDEHEIGASELESESPIVTTKDKVL
jgi:hypothetical protein